MESDQCFASWDPTGVGSYDCQLPVGHDGPHEVTIEWDESPRVETSVPVSVGYGLYLASRYGGN